MEDMACFHNHDRKLFACIEAKNMQTYEIRRVVECDGQDFVNFKWDAVATGGFGSAAANHTLRGLRLVTRDEEIAVRPDGSIERFERSEEDKRYHYETFGR